MSTENLQKFYNFLESHPNFIPAITGKAIRRFGALNADDYVNDFICSMADGSDAIAWDKTDKEILTFLYRRFINHVVNLNRPKFSLYATSSDRAFSSKYNTVVDSYSATILNDAEEESNTDAVTDALIDKRTLRLFDAKELAMDLRKAVPTLQNSLQPTAEYFLDCVERQVGAAAISFQGVAKTFNIPLTTAKFRYRKVMLAFYDYLTNVSPVIE